MKNPINTAIIGFGLSGQVFHAPFIRANPGFVLKTIVTQGDLAGKLYPATLISRNFDEVLADQQIELVIVASPNRFHFEQAAQILRAGKHVIVEKPFTPTSAEAQQLIELAEKSDCLLFPFHNRRWDGDFLTLKQIISEGLLGEIRDYQVHFDRFNPVITRASWRYSNTIAGGTLYDLGIHLIDQAVNLLGKPEGVFCRLFNQRAGSVVDDSFDLKLIYPKMNASLRASVFVKEPGPRFIVHGTQGSYIKYGIDPQEAALREGKIPGSKNWGTEPVKNHGLLHTQAYGNLYRGKYKTLPGNYMAFFDNIYNTISGNEKPEVKAEEAMLNIQIIEKAIESNRLKCIIPLNS